MSSGGAIGILSKTVAAVDERLTAKHFQRSGKWRWMRDVDWRIDEVDLAVEGAGRFNVRPSFRVQLRLLSDSRQPGGYEYLAHDNVDRILRPGESAARLWIPTLSFLGSRFAKRIAGSIEAALPWFDRFSTPESCRAHLDEHLVPGSPAYVDAVRALDYLIAEPGMTRR